MAEVKYWVEDPRKYTYHIDELRRSAGLTLKDFCGRIGLPFYLCANLCRRTQPGEYRLLRPEYIDRLKTFFGCEESDIVTLREPESEVPRREEKALSRQDALAAYFLQNEEAMERLCCSFEEWQRKKNERANEVEDVANESGENNPHPAADDHRPRSRRREARRRRAGNGAH